MIFQVQIHHPQLTVEIVQLTGSRQQQPLAEITQQAGSQQQLKAGRTQPIGSRQLIAERVQPIGSQSQHIAVKTHLLGSQQPQLIVKRTQQAGSQQQQPIAEKHLPIGL